MEKEKIPNLNTMGEGWGRKGNEKSLRDLITKDLTFQLKEAQKERRKKVALKSILRNKG